MSSETSVISQLQLPPPQKIVKYKCTLCFYDAFNKENVEKHIKKTSKCAEAQIVEIEIKCDFCDKPFGSEMSKISHEKICKSKKLEDELEGLSIDDQNKLLRKRYHDQNKYLELIEKQLRLLKSKFAREEEVNNVALQNEHGFSASELHQYCVFTLRRLFEEVILPGVSANIDLRQMKEAEKKHLTTEVEEIPTTQTQEAEEEGSKKKTSVKKKAEKTEKVLEQE